MKQVAIYIEDDMFIVDHPGYSPKEALNKLLMATAIVKRRLYYDRLVKEVGDSYDREAMDGYLDYLYDSFSKKKRKELAALR